MKENIIRYLKENENNEKLVSIKDELSKIFDEQNFKKYYSKFLQKVKMKWLNWKYKTEKIYQVLHISQNDFKEIVETFINND